MDDVRKRTWAEIDLTRLARNYRALRALTDPECRFMGVVKANAYGHGAVPVAQALEALGAEYLSVACLDEALELREAGIQSPILIMGLTPPEYTGALLEHNITQTVGDVETAAALSAVAMAAGKPLTVHLKVDTGMSRLGLLCDEAHLLDAAESVRRAWSLPGLRWEGIFTHFANADGDEAYTMRQFARFLDLLDILANGGISFPIRHCASSAAVLNYPCTHMDMIRPGIALYGHYPAPGMEYTCPLEPVMTLKTRVAAVRDLPAGTAVSYGCTRVLERDSRVAVLPVGYADGYFRLFSDVLEVQIREGRAPLLGRVCMDMCMVALDEDAQVEPGDEAEIFGSHLPAEAQAELAGTIQYELLCAVSPRVPRVYV